MGEYKQNKIADQEMKIQVEAIRTKNNGNGEVGRRDSKIREKEIRIKLLSVMG